MSSYNNPDFLFTFDAPAVPPISPVSGRAKLWELEEDNAYLNYLYPEISKQIREFTDEACDKLEYEGSLMFDAYPDKTSLRILARRILRDFQKKYPESKDCCACVDQAENGQQDSGVSCRENMLCDMIEVILYNEIMFRRNRYRSHKRLYL